MLKRTLIIIGIAGISVTIVYLCNHIGFNFSNSVDFRVYWHIPFTEVRRDAYYIIEYNDNGQIRLLTKRAACLPGETLSRQDATFLCNGAEVTRIQITHDISGEEYPQYEIPIEGGLLNNTAFMLGDSVQSYDSRYFGAVPISSFRREVHPIW